MPRANLSSVVRYIRRAAGSSVPQGLTDAQLLARYRTQRDSDAFAELVHRHGPLVHSVCRRILHHEQDSEDACQATFLVLASKASSIRKAVSLASWLHGVAYRIAMRAKKTLGRQHQNVGDAAAPTQDLPVTAAALREAQLIVDEELNRLPEKYRAPFILCCLEGKSRPEAARELGWKEGTVSSRIAQARKLLQQRLTRRGVVLSATLCVLDLTRAAAPAIGTSIVDRTVKAAVSFAAGQSAATDLATAPAVALARGVLLAMSTTSKLKIATALVLACGLMTATGAIGRQAMLSAEETPQQGSLDERETSQKNQKTAEARSRKEDFEIDKIDPAADRLVGEWKQIVTLKKADDTLLVMTFRKSGICRLDALDRASRKQPEGPDAHLPGVGLWKVKGSDLVITWENWNQGKQCPIEQVTRYRIEKSTEKELIYRAIVPGRPPEQFEAAKWVRFEGWWLAALLRP